MHVSFVHNLSVYVLEEVINGSGLMNLKAYKMTPSFRSSYISIYFIRQIFLPVMDARDR